MEQNILVSVCINAYNAEKTIAETVQSVLDQTYRNLQIIIVDDCSADNTAAIVRQFRDERIELYCMERNGGISKANNECLRRARGAYVAHLDSDDVWAPDKIEKQVAFLEEHPRYGACFSHTDFIDEQGRPFDPDASGIPGLPQTDIFRIGNLSQAGYLRLFFEKSNHLCHSTLLMRSSVYEAVGEHDMTMWYLHDFDYWVRMIQRFPIYIFQENLVHYRIHGNNNSAMPGRKKLSHNEEFVRILYKLVDACPNDIFLEAFSDKLRVPGAHTDVETELEKAFVLLDGLQVILPGNRLLGVRKLDELMEKEAYRLCAEEKFGFSVRDLYALHESNLYFDPNEAHLSEQKTEQAEQLTAALQTENALLRDAANEREYRLGMAWGQLNTKTNAWRYKPISLLKKGKHALKKGKRLLFPRLENGKRPCMKLMLYGFFGHNVGDDLFFDMLFKRYPDTLFYVLITPDYQPFFSRYSNVRYYDVTGKWPTKLNELGARFGKRDLFESCILSVTDGAVHIGGSIYQQIGDWKLDYSIRKKRKKRGKLFFAVSNNFGAYTEEAFRAAWEIQFHKWTDICFRDQYSRNLFPAVKQARFAPDLIFHYTPGSYSETRKAVISVINTRLAIRDFSDAVCAEYADAIRSMICTLTDRGYQVTLVSFCELEQDAEQIRLLRESLPPRIAGSVKTVIYRDDLTRIFEEIGTAEYVIATRFHAMILGYVFGKKVLPLCYSEKMSHVVQELSLSDRVIRLSDLNAYTAEELLSFANTLSEEKLLRLRQTAEQQFAGIDQWVRKKNGVIYTG